MKKIAIFRALQLGDMLCCIPAVRALRAAYPRAEISLVGLPWAKECITRFPAYFDRFFSFPGYPGLSEQEPDYDAIPAFISRMQAEKFDLLLQMHGSGQVTNLFVVLCNAGNTAGYFLTGNFCPDDRLFFPYPEEVREVRKWISLIEHLGIAPKGEELEFPISVAEQATYQKLAEFYGLKRNEYICIHPGSRDAKRRWPPSYFARVADLLANAGFRIVLTGTEAEMEICRAVGNSINRPFYNLAGKTMLGTLAALIRRSALVISNDTGVSHIADALKKPSIIIFMHSRPEIWAPLDNTLHRVVFAEKSVPEQVFIQADLLLRKSLIKF